MRVGRRERAVQPQLCDWDSDNGEISVSVATAGLGREAESLLPPLSPHTMGAKASKMKGLSREDLEFLTRESSDITS